MQFHCEKEIVLKRLITSFMKEIFPVSLYISILLLFTGFLYGQTTLQSLPEEMAQKSTAAFHAEEGAFSLQIEALSILFIGNSFTADAPTIVDFLARDAGWPHPNIGARVEGGRELSYYRQDSACLALVDQGGWDYVVLQEYSIKPTEIGNPQEFKEDVTWFYDRIKLSSPDAHIVLYETWAFYEDHAYYSPYAFEDPEDFQSQLHFHYFDCAENYVPAHATFNPPDDISVAPVGDVWQYHQAEENPIHLFSLDNKHQNYTGRYLNALVLYAYIFNKPTLGLTNLWLTTPEYAKRLQQTVDCWFGYRCDNSGDVIIAGFQSWDDPPGQNDGEFIELFNTTDESIALDNLEVEVRFDADQDGIAEIYWQLNENTAGMVIQPHGFFLLAEPGVAARGDDLHDLELWMDLPTDGAGTDGRAVSIEVKIDGLHMDYVLYGRQDGNEPAGEILTGDLFFKGHPWPRKEVIRNTTGTADFREGLTRRETAGALFAPFYEQGFYADEDLLPDGYPKGVWSCRHDIGDGDYLARNSLSPKVFEADWVVYNDCSAGNASANALFVTSYSYSSPAGGLLDYQVGNLLNVQVAGEVQGDPITPPDNSGGQAQPGTDAALVFGPEGEIIADLDQSLPLEFGMQYTLYFTNLDPDGFYDLCLTANHDDPLLDGSCYTKVGLAGADACVNRSSPGVEVIDDHTVSFCTGYNTIQGYVAYWSDIQPGTDGSISVISTWDDSKPGDRGFAMGVYRLEKRASNRWLGSVSDDWNDRENWEAGYPPSAVSTVVIDAPALDKFHPETNSGEPGICSNLLIKTGGRLTIPAGNGLTVINHLMNEAGTAGLVIDCSTQATGSLVHHTGDVPATVRQFLSSNAWHYVSSPVQHAVSGVFENMYLRSFNAFTDAWDPYITSTTHELIPGKGYAAWTSGEHALVSFEGMLNNGPVSFPVSCNAGAVNQGWNLAGNPYPSSIDWNAPGWDKSAIDNTVYLWQGVGDGGDGNYHYYIGADGEEPGFGVNDAKSVIQPMQGFFVHAHQNGTLGMDNTIREHNHFPFLKQSLSVSQMIRLSVEKEDCRDETVIRFKDGASIAFEGNRDAFKLLSTGYPQIYSVDENGVALAIHSLPPEEQERYVNLGFRAPDAGFYTLRLKQFSNFDPDTELFLEDNFQHHVVNLGQDSVYAFYADEGEGVRFRLYFKDPGNVPAPYGPSVRITAKQQGIQILSTGSDLKTVEVYDLAGRMVCRQSLHRQSNVYVPLPGLKGCYIARVNTDQKVETGKIIIR